MHILLKKLRTANPGILAIGALAAFAFAVVAVTAAKAADKGKPKKPVAASEDVIPLPKAAKSWTGVGLGVHTSWQTGALDLGGPINIGVEGPTLGASAIAMVQLQQLVVGAEISYNHFFGDPKTIGGNYDMAATLIGGVSMGNVLPYLCVSPLARVETDFGHSDGFGVCGGVMWRPESSKIVYDIRAERRTFDDFLGSGADVHINSVRIGGKYLFQLPQ